MIKLLTLLAISAASAQSSKFAAVYSPRDAVRFLTTCAYAETSDFYTSAPAAFSAVCTDPEESYGPDNKRSGLTMARIKVPKGMELLVGLSAQIELFTSTVVSGRRGSKSTSLSTAEGGVELYACRSPKMTIGSDCIESVNGFVTLSRREQELSGVFGGVINECDVTADSITGDLSFDLSQCDVDYESIGLSLNTLAAHHFNFVFKDMPASGDWFIKAKFTTRAQAEITEAFCPESATYCLDESEVADPADADPQAQASTFAAVGKYSMTIQQVRAVKDSLVAKPIIDLS